MEHNARAVLNRFLGYWDANPATLFPPNPAESAPLKVEMMGGAEPIMARCAQLLDEGTYLLAVQLLDPLVHAEPGNAAARQLLADAFELRSGLPQGLAPSSTGPDLLRALTTGQFLDFMGIRLDPAKAETRSFRMNLVTPDNGEQYAVELSNGTLTNLLGYRLDDADLTLTIERPDLVAAIAGVVPLAQQVAEGRATVEGDPSLLLALGEMLVHFDPGFEIMPDTGEAHLAATSTRSPRTRSGTPPAADRPTCARVRTAPVTTESPTIDAQRGREDRCDLRVRARQGGPRS